MGTFNMIQCVVFKDFLSSENQVEFYVGELYCRLLAQISKEELPIVWVVSLRAYNCITIQLYCIVVQYNYRYAVIQKVPTCNLV